MPEKSSPSRAWASRSMTIRGDAKDRGAGGEHAPERAPAAAQAPAGLVDVERRGAADVAEQILVGLVERRGRALQDRLHGAGRRARRRRARAASSVVSRRETRFLTARVATAACRRGPKAPRRNPGAAARRASRRRTAGQRRRCRRCSLRRTAIEGSSATWWRAGLPTGRRSASLKRWPQAAALGPVLDELIDCFDGRQMTTVSRVARLGPSLAARRRGLPALAAPLADRGWGAARSCASCG